MRQATSEKVSSPIMSPSRLRHNSRRWWRRRCYSDNTKGAGSKKESSKRVDQRQQAKNDPSRHAWKREKESTLESSGHAMSQLRECGIPLPSVAISSLQYYFLCSSTRWSDVVTFLLRETGVLSINRIGVLAGRWICLRCDAYRKHCSCFDGDLILLATENLNA